MSILAVCAVLTADDGPPGNNYGIGETRLQELQGSCTALGIHPKRCIALNHPELQDNPKVWWDADLLQGIVHDHVKQWKVDAVRPPLSLAPPQAAASRWS